MAKITVFSNADLAACAADGLACQAQAQSQFDDAYGWGAGAGTVAGIGSGYGSALVPSVTAGLLIMGFVAAIAALGFLAFRAFGQRRREAALAECAKNLQDCVKEHSFEVEVPG